MFEKFEPWVWLESAWAPGTNTTGKGWLEISYWASLFSFIFKASGRDNTRLLFLLSRSNLAKAQLKIKYARSQAKIQQFKGCLFNPRKNGTNKCLSFYIRKSKTIFLQNIFDKTTTCVIFSSGIVVHFVEPYISIHPAIHYNKPKTQQPTNLFLSSKTFSPSNLVKKNVKIIVLSQIWYDQKPYLIQAKNT